MGFFANLFKKANPAQQEISREEPSASRSNLRPITTANAYRNVEVFNRCVNMLIDNAAQVNYDVKEAYSFTALGSGVAAGGIRKQAITELLNVRPNPWMDISTFRRLLLMDFIMEGWAFIHWDGTALYHIPAAHMEVYSDPKKYVNKYVYAGKVTFKPNEIIFIKDNAYRGMGSDQLTAYPRVMSSLGSLIRREKLLKFKEKFFDNGAVLSLIVETEAVLSKKLKQRFEDEMKLDYNPNTGKSSIKVLDAGMKARTLTPTNAKDFDITEDVEIADKNVCTALGVPPILLDSGNNANIRPNIDLLYYMTIIPMLKKWESAMEIFFGYDIKLSTEGILALLPDDDAQAKAVTAKVNNGLLTPNEGREELRYAKLEGQDMDKIRIPQNIAGSGTGVSGEEGGKPSGSGSKE